MIPNLLLLTGNDSFRLYERMKFYKTAFREKYADGEIENFDKEQDFNHLENTVLTPNLFGGRRCVFLEEFWDPEKFEQAEKAEFFEKLPDFADSVTVFVIEPSLDKRLKWAKFLLKKAKVETFEPLDEFGLLQWIEGYAKKHGGHIQHHNAKILLNRCGENCWNLSQEIQKLVIGGNGEITEELIKSLTVPHPKAIIWDFLAHLSRKNISGAIRNFRILLYAGEPIHQLLAMVNREVRIHAQIRHALDQHIPQSQIASATKLHPFVVQKTIPLTQNFSQLQIKKMYETLFLIDQKMKTGGISVSTDDNSELALAIEKFIVESCRS